MGLMRFLFGSGSRRQRRDSASGAATQPASTSPPSTRSAPTSLTSIRKESLRAAFRDALFRNGIPESWLGMDALRTVSAQQRPGIHARFLLKVWKPDLMVHGPAFERDVFQRLLALDPEAGTWIQGFSWQYALLDKSACPPLPPYHTWAPAPAWSPAHPRQHVLR